jgi:hypothetical protein
VLLAGIVRHLDRVGDVTKAAPVAIGASSATNVSGGGVATPLICPPPLMSPHATQSPSPPGTTRLCAAPAPAGSREVEPVLTA